MLKTAEKMVKEVKTIATELTASITHEHVMDMDVEEFQIYKSVFELLDLSCNVILEQAEQMDEMNEKLDMLIEMAKRHK